MTVEISARGKAIVLILCQRVEKPKVIDKMALYQLRSKHRWAVVVRVSRYATIVDVKEVGGGEGREGIVTTNFSLYFLHFGLKR